jgi:F-type H+-transporting ATPase subunit delta
MAAVDKTYGDALFSLVTEEDEKALPDILGQLKGVSEVFAAEPDFIKLLRTPTIPIEEKTALVKEVFDGKVHKFVVNFLCILTENDRLPDFERILAYFTGLYNEKLGIADVTVTSAMPLSDTAAKRSEQKWLRLRVRPLI